MITTIAILIILIFTLVLDKIDVEKDNRHLQRKNWLLRIENFNGYSKINQLELFEKLYEWHFDIHGGIGKWAIDINTL